MKYPHKILIFVELSLDGFNATIRNIHLTLNIIRHGKQNFNYWLTFYSICLGM